MTEFLQGVNTQIDPADEMFLVNLNSFKRSALATSIYFRQGAEINNTVQQLLNWRFPSRKAEIKFLDFACGYGRFTRFLVCEIPPRQVWVSDIYCEAVAFQRRVFGVNGFESCSDPTQLVCDQRFDMIFSSSLFTHLPADAFAAWLKRLFELLEPEGMLAFSVHDESLVPGRVIPESGILFLPASESRTLDTSEYGTNSVTEGFVGATIRAVCGPAWPYTRLPRALAGEQDLYIVSKDGVDRFAGFNLLRPQLGYVESFDLSPDGLLRLTGWSGDPNDGVELEAIQVRIGGRLIMSSKPTISRNDVAKVHGDKFAFSGWECVCDVGPNPDLSVPVEVKAISQNGSSTILHLMPLAVAREPRPALATVQVAPPVELTPAKGSLSRLFRKWAALAWPGSRQ